MTTVAFACVATCSETLPWSNREMAPSPREPSTTMSYPSSSTSFSIVVAGSPEGSSNRR